MKRKLLDPDRLMHFFTSFHRRHFGALPCIAFDATGRPFCRMLIEDGAVKITLVALSEKQKRDVAEKEFIRIAAACNKADAKKEALSSGSHYERVSG